ncbi:hypothetical protein Hanom_Chr05g00424661 [Helianthus anomalus]
MLVTDEEGTDDDSNVEMIVPEAVEDTVRDLTFITPENLKALIASLQDSLGNPPFANVPLQEEHTEDVEPNTEHVSLNVEPEPVMQAEPEISTATQDTDIPDFINFDMPETTARSQLESSSGVRFDVGSSSDGLSEQDKASMRVTAKKMKFIEEADSNEDMDVYIAKLQRRVIVLEQDDALKDTNISPLQTQVSSKKQQ